MTRRTAVAGRFLASACVWGIGLLLVRCPAWAQEATAPFTLDTRPDLPAGLPLFMLSDVAPATDAQPDDRWEFRLAPYLWLAGMDGKLTARGRTASVDQDLSDVIDLLSDHFNAGGAVRVEAEKGSFGVFADALYLDLRAERDMRLETTIDAQMEQFIGELGLFYTLIEPQPKRNGTPTFRLDLLGGARFTWLQLEVDTEPLGSATRTRDWIDPFIGARVDLGLARWLSFKARGDIGGFDIDPGTTSKLVWNIDTAASFHLSRSIDLDLGYHWLDYDYEKGSGRDRFAFDATLSGPYLAIQFRF